MENSVLKFKSKYRSEGVKVYFSAYEFRQKPIKYWANVGNIPKYSKLNKLKWQIRRLLNIRCANTILHISHYAGGRTLFPVQVNWMKSLNRFEFIVWCPFGQKQLISIRREFSSFNERLTDDEIKNINRVLKMHSHIIRDSYDYYQKLIDNPRTWSEISKLTRELKSELIP